MTTRAEIAEWYERGVEQGKSFMVVFVDTWDHEDYPAYYDDAEQARAAVAGADQWNRVMEVYDLTRDKVVQIASPRAWSLP